MQERVKSQRAPLYLFLLTFLLALSTASTLCENRCERANPRLRTLKILWNRSLRRMTGSDISFDEFIKSLITATDDRPMMGPLRNDLLRMIGRYRDCAVACEHQFSKRGGTEQHLGSRLSLLCEMVTRNGISTLSETVKDYCRPYSDFSDTSF